MLDPSTPDSLVEEHASDLLARRPSGSLPLSGLHRALTDAFGPVFRTPPALRDWLRARPRRFTVLDPPACVLSTSALVRERRAEYAAALEAAGLPPEPRVVLTTPPADAGAALAQRLDASILALCRARGDDPTLPNDAAEALAAARALRRALAARH